MARIRTLAGLFSAMPRLLRDAKARILNEHVAKDGLTVFAHARQRGAEGIVSKMVNVPIDQVRAAYDRWR